MERSFLSVPAETAHAACFQDTSNTMHLLRSAGKAPQQLPARELPAIGSANSQELSAALPEAVAQQAPRGLAQKEVCA